MPAYWGWVDCDSGHSRFRMFLGGNDDAVALRFFWNGCYESTTLRAWAWLAKKARFVLDIGAHTGAFSLAASAANPGCYVASFEPHFMNFSRLTLNLRSNGFSTRNAYPLGVGGENQTLPFSIPTHLDYLTTGGSIGVRDKGFTTHVEVVALDSFINDSIKSQIALIKIDVEGFEGPCLSGMREIISSSEPIIFFECIDKNAGMECQDILSAFGYQFFESDDRSGRIEPVRQVAPVLDATGKPVMNRLNRIAVPERVDFGEVAS